MNRFVPAVVCFFLLLGALAFAQNPASPSGAASSSNPLANELGLITLEFPGGTVAQYIDAVRKASNDANIVVIGDVTPIQMPPVRLKNVDTWAALNIINQLPQQQKDLLINIAASLTSDQPDQERVYTVSAQTTRAGSLGASVQSVVLSVADVLKGDITADDLLTAIKIAVDVGGMADEPADIKFHKETGLLIARGSGAQISAIHEVVGQLEEQIRPRPVPAQDIARAGEVRQALKDRDAQTAALEKRIAQLEEQIAKLTANP